MQYKSIVVLGTFFFSVSSFNLVIDLYTVWCPIYGLSTAYHRNSEISTAFCAFMACSDTNYRQCNVVSFFLYTSM